jgi:anti-sigma-K factor RskA
VKRPHIGRLPQIGAARPFSALAGLSDEAPFWRSLAAGLAVVALALLVAGLIGRTRPDFSARPIIAVLRDGGQHPLWAIRLARSAHQIAADSLQPPPVPPGHVYQLWLEPPGAGSPHPLGLLPQSGRKEIAETPGNIRLLSSRRALVVTLEPEGGSPDAGPTGPVLFRGILDGKS